MHTYAYIDIHNFRGAWFKQTPSSFPPQGRMKYHRHTTKARRLGVFVCLTGLLGQLRV